jgi:hypothetical protein
MDKSNLLPRGGEYQEMKGVFEKGTHRAKSEFHRVRQGTANTKTLKTVCKNCNTGWMSGLESDVQPFLTPLIVGDRILLDLRACQTIAEWVTMKVLVAEHNSFKNHPADPIFDQTIRSSFMQSRVVPGGFRIWIAVQNSAKWVTGFYRFATGLGFTTAWPPPPSPPDRPKTVQSVTWGIGKLLIYVQAFTDPDLYNRLSLNPKGPFSRLWPFASDIAWPLRYYLPTDSIDRLARALDEFVMSDAITRTAPFS